MYPMRKKSHKPVGPNGKVSGPMPDSYRRYVGEQVETQLEFAGYADKEITAVLASPQYAEALRWYWEDLTAVCLWEGTVVFGKLQELGLNPPGSDIPFE